MLTFVIVFEISTKFELKLHDITLEVLSVYLSVRLLNTL